MNKRRMAVSNFVVIGQKFGTKYEMGGKKGVFTNAAGLFTVYVIARQHRGDPFRPGPIPINEQIQPIIIGSVGIDGDWSIDPQTDLTLNSFISSVNRKGVGVFNRDLLIQIQNL